jgi:hypothetical protein
MGGSLPPAYPIAAKAGRKPAIVELPEVPSDRGQHRPIADFPYTLEVQISYALNAIVIHATGNGSAIAEHRQCCPEVKTDRHYLFSHNVVRLSAAKVVQRAEIQAVAGILIQQKAPQRLKLLRLGPIRFLRQILKDQLRSLFLQFFPDPHKRFDVLKRRLEIQPLQSQIKKLSAVYSPFLL